VLWSRPEKSLAKPTYEADDRHGCDPKHHRRCGRLCELSLPGNICSNVWVTCRRVDKGETMRAPRLSDAVWIFLGAFLFMSLRMMFTPDPPVPCPEGTGCSDAYGPGNTFYDAGATHVP
jgi:hypothetical protein